MLGNMAKKLLPGAINWGAEKLSSVLSRGAKPNSTREYVSKIILEEAKPENLKDIVQCVKSRRNRRIGKTKKIQKSR